MYFIDVPELKRPKFFQVMHVLRLLKHWKFRKVDDRVSGCWRVIEEVGTVLQKFWGLANEGDQGNFLKQAGISMHVNEVL